METYFMSGRSSSPILRFRLLPPKLFLRSPQVLPLVLQDFSCNLQARSQEERSEARNRMFILGMGFVGQFFADQLKKDGWEVIGTCTSDAKMKKLEGMGFDVHLFDSNDPELRSLHTMESASHLLISIPSVAGLGDPVLHQHKDLLQSRLSHGNLQWLCYLSSTSVYGDSGGAWVDEDYPTNPTSESAKARVDAERGWLKLGHDLGISAQVFRLGGIYGPGRSALDTILRQESLSKGQKMREARRYTSRVHIADICQALKASINMPTFGVSCTKKRTRVSLMTAEFSLHYKVRNWK
ncbi:PREDICTED: uncharacterized protein LOC104595612 isoform X2 [Nelumbo nucifera]|uniref:Uncharacterized protein LOC104595612 isoform X2 n=1 Tax=Nelumbo nucifera TaxID=4432 RepID=A0A1U7ZKY3_NELNU|nr:PREDICTED: uncharacterized protein LOC104595612 isoform X2 [Nelumbo nucifera]